MLYYPTGERWTWEINPPKESQTAPTRGLAPSHPRAPQRQQDNGWQRNRRQNTLPSSWSNRDPAATQRSATSPLPPRSP
jgi:hypothetical protein